VRDIRRVQCSLSRARFQTLDGFGYAEYFGAAGGLAEIGTIEILRTRGSFRDFQSQEAARIAIRGYGEVLLSIRIRRGAGSMLGCGLRQHARADDNGWWL
jgi:hypothetical protein